MAMENSNMIDTYNIAKCKKDCGIQLASIIIDLQITIGGKYATDESVGDFWILHNWITN